MGLGLGCLPGPRAVPLLGSPGRERDVEGLRQRLVRTLPLSPAPPGLQTGSPVPLPAERKRELF